MDTQQLEYNCYTGSFGDIKRLSKGQLKIKARKGTYDIYHDKEGLHIQGAGGADGAASYTLQLNSESEAFAVIFKNMEDKGLIDDEECTALKDITGKTKSAALKEHEKGRYNQELTLQSMQQAVLAKFTDISTLEFLALASGISKKYDYKFDTSAEGGVSITASLESFVQKQSQTYQGRVDKVPTGKRSKDKGGIDSLNRDLVALLNRVQRGNVIEFKSLLGLLRKLPTAIHEDDFKKPINVNHLNSFCSNLARVVASQTDVEVLHAVCKYLPFETISSVLEANWNASKIFSENKVNLDSSLVQGHMKEITGLYELHLELYDCFAKLDSNQSLAEALDLLEPKAEPYCFTQRSLFYKLSYVFASVATLGLFHLVFYKRAFRRVDTTNFNSRVKALNDRQKTLAELFKLPDTPAAVETDSPEISSAGTTPDRSLVTPDRSLVVDKSPESRQIPDAPVASTLIGAAAATGLAVAAQLPLELIPWAIAAGSVLGAGAGLLSSRLFSGSNSQGKRASIVTAGSAAQDSKTVKPESGPAVSTATAVDMADDPKATPGPQNKHHSE